MYKRMGMAASYLNGKLLKFVVKQVDKGQISKVKRTLAFRQNE